MPFIYLRDLDSVMVTITEDTSTSIIRSGFGFNPFTVETAMSIPLEWESRFLFEFVENPFERLVSALLMFRKHSSANGISFAAKSLTIENILNVIEDDSVDIHGTNYWSRLKRHSIPVTHPHFRIQEVDFLGRRETVAWDWAALCGLLSFRHRPFAFRQQRGRQHHYSSFFNWRDRERAFSIFAEDLEEFGYSFQTDLRETSKSSFRKAA